MNYDAHVLFDEEDNLDKLFLGGGGGRGRGGGFGGGRGGGFGGGKYSYLLPIRAV